MWEMIDEKCREEGKLDPESYFGSFFSNDCLNFTSAIALLLQLQKPTAVTLSLVHTNYSATIEQVRQAKLKASNIWAELNPSSPFFTKEDFKRKAGQS
jgi:dihydroorotase-like cyclic amidohydrolase